MLSGGVDVWQCWLMLRSGIAANLVNELVAGITRVNYNQSPLLNAMVLAVLCCAVVCSSFCFVSLRIGWRGGVVCQF